MPWGAAIGAAAAIYGSEKSSSAAKSAAKTQANAANSAAQVQQNIYNQTRTDLSPYFNTGTGALNQLASLYGIQSTPNTAAGGGTATQFDGTQVTPLGGSTTNGAASTGGADYSAFMNSPDYQFALQQGIGALDKSAAASGRLYSGGYGKDLTNYAQGMASQQLNTYANRLQSIAGIGQAAAAGQAAAGQNYATNTGNLMTQAANASATGTINSANAWANGVNQLASAYGQYSNNTSNNGQSSNPFSDYNQFGGSGSYL